MTRPGLAQGLSYSKVLGSCHTASGGWGGIRTPGGREPTPVFKTGALNHSATHPTHNIKHLAFQSYRTKPQLPPAIIAPLAVNAVSIDCTVVFPTSGAPMHVVMLGCTR